MYMVRYTGEKPELLGLWNGHIWSGVDIGEILNYRCEGSCHKPNTRFRLSYSDMGISGIFFVEDRYVKSVHCGYMAPVYKDSCVEFFVRPDVAKGYFNFEFNCGGSVLCSYITDHTRVSGGFKEYVPFTEQDLESVEVFHSLPEIITEEIKTPVNWILEFFIPFSVFEKYSGKIGYLPGRTWEANFYKCGDSSSHPHWGSWKPLSELNFHIPDCFGSLYFKTE